MNKRQLYVSGFLCCCITILSQCISKAPQKPDSRGESFAGAAACAGCHKSIYDAFLTSAHHNTSRPAAKATVLGSFLSPDNVFHYPNGGKVQLEARDSGLFQVAYTHDSITAAHPFDITIGSGRKAQTYLYWQDNKYYQLPLSYFVPAANWANSPGFPATYPRFDRVIPSTCFGCHSSGVTLTDVKMEGLRLSESFAKNEVIYGIDCERCHGAAAAHVNFHTAHPAEKQGRYITKISSLKNQQRLDMCGLCHSGLKTPQKSAFSFKPGDSLSDYFFPEPGKPAKATEMDVHGTQYQLFTASQCAVMSTEMNCSSCHNPHTKESSDIAVFSQRCMNCHATTGDHFCKLKGFGASVLAANCIDCHMPALPSGNITLLTNGETKPTPDYIRTHLISIYPEETKKVIERLRKK